MLDALGAVVILVQPIAEPNVIIVTGQGIEKDERLAASVTIDRIDIERSASGRMEDVLRDVAGLASFRRSDSRSAHPTSQGLTPRGLGGNAASRVTVSLDGVPQADPFGGWIAFTALDPHTIDRIRVVRGGGVDAVAGTIDIDSRAPEPGDSVDASLLGGSRSSLDARLLGGTNWGGGFASVSGRFARGDGFVPIVAADRGAADQRAPYRQGSARARLVQALGNATEAQLNLSTYADRRSRGTDFSDNRQRGSDASLRLVGNGTTRWSALAYVQQRRFDSQFAAIAADRNTARLALDQHVPARGWGARVEVAPRIGAVKTRVGAEWRLASGETLEDFRFVAGAPTRQREAGGRSVTSGLFAEATWSKGGWSAGVEARADRWEISNGRLVEADLAGTLLTNRRFADRSGWEGSGRVELGRTLGKAVTLRAAAFRGWRLPTLNELYRPFRVGADATSANAGLVPERLRGVEAGVDWVPAKGAKLSGTVFANWLKGAIANVTLGAGPGLFPGVGFVAAGGVFRMRQNVDAIVSRGLEVDASLARGARGAKLRVDRCPARRQRRSRRARRQAPGPGRAPQRIGLAEVGAGQARPHHHRPLHRPPI